IPVSPTTAREIPASGAICSASARPVANAAAACPIANAGSAPTVAGQITALSAKFSRSASLTVSEGITARRAPKPVSPRAVPISGARPMFWIMLPTVARVAAAGWQRRSPIATAKVVAIAATGYRIRRTVATSDVVTVSATYVEIIVSVNGNVVVTAPATSPAPTSAPESAHHDANAEGKRHASAIVPPRRIVDRRVGIHCRTVHHHGIIRRHIHDLRIRLFDDDHGLPFDDLGFYLLLLGRFQIALVLRLFAHALYGIHHIALLCQERVAQI